MKPCDHAGSVRAMASSKYERELRFMESEIMRNEVLLRGLTERVPADPEEARATAEKIDNLRCRIKEMEIRKKEILSAYAHAGMDAPDTSRSMNATVHDAGNSEYRRPPVIDGQSDELACVTSEIGSISSELSKVESSLAMAMIEGDSAECEKLTMMASSLRSRRDSLVERAMEIRASEDEVEEDEEPADRISALESDMESVRTQVGNLRGDIQDIKESIRTIISALGLDDQ